MARKQSLMEELERAERELDSVRGEAEEAKTNLVRFREEIRALVREKSRMLATLANAQARRRIQRALEGLSVDAEMKALEAVREHVARIATEGALDRELGGDEAMKTRLRAIRDEAREEAARKDRFRGLCFGSFGLGLVVFFVAFTLYTWSIYDKGHWAKLEVAGFKMQAQVAQPPARAERSNTLQFVLLDAGGNLLEGLQPILAAAQLLLQLDVLDAQGAVALGELGPVGDRGFELVREVGEALLEGFGGRGARFVGRLVGGPRERGASGHQRR